MSLFQCRKCGCIENTACTECSHCTFLMNNEFKKAKEVISNNEHVKNPDKRDKEYVIYKRIFEALLSYKVVLDLDPDQEFENYCSACCPVWFDKKMYGIGPNPDPQPEMGKWHGIWTRRKFPMGSIKTNQVGNMVYTKDGSPVKISDGELME